MRGVVLALALASCLPPTVIIAPAMCPPEPTAHESYSPPLVRELMAQCDALKEEPAFCACVLVKLHEQLVPGDEVRRMLRGTKKTSPVVDVAMRVCR